jgi:uncharacterized Fe-S radical SAM superfamily protein PflX
MSMVGYKSEAVETVSFSVMEQHTPQYSGCEYRATLNHDPIIDELFTSEDLPRDGGDDEQLPPLSPL